MYVFRSPLLVLTPFAKTFPYFLQYKQLSSRVVIGGCVCLYDRISYIKSSRYNTYDAIVDSTLSIKTYIFDVFKLKIEKTNERLCYYGHHIY